MQKKAASSEELLIEPETRAMLEERINRFLMQMRRGIESLLNCKHHMQADRCDDCKGKTQFDVPIETMLQLLEEKGVLEMEPFIGGEKSAGESGHRPRLKTILGVGAGFFFAIVGLQGAKLVGRLIQRNNRTP